MATDTAAALAKTIGPDPTRHLWQVPLFLIGALLFVAAWQGWIPIAPPSQWDLFQADRAALQDESERRTDREKLKDLLAKVNGNVDSFPDQGSLSHFVLGSGYVRLAELTASVEESRGYWLLAQQHFALVDEAFRNSPDIDKKMTFRSAKARAAAGLPSGATVKEIRDQIELLGHAPLGEEQGEAARLQADLAMRLSPPDLTLARDALRRYLKGAGPDTPSISLNRARPIGNVYFLCRELEPARDSLKNIDADAPQDLLVASKVLLGRVLMAEEDWREASRKWTEVRSMPNQPASIRTISAYLLGVCKLSTHELEEATKLFEEAVKGEDRPETSAAAIKLAELYLKSPELGKRVAAADLLVKSTKGISNVKDLRFLPNITPMVVHTVFEQALSILTNDAAFEAAMKVAVAYTPIAEAGRDIEKRADVQAAWANALKKSGGEYQPKAVAAAKEYIAFATFQPAASAKADTLRRAAAMYRLSDDAASAVAALQEAAKLPKLEDEVAGPVWFDLANSLLAAKRADEVWPAFNEAMRAGGPISTATRNLLAHKFMECPQPEFRLLGRLLLEQIAKQSVVTQAEQEIQEHALLDLAHEYIRARDFASAENWLRQQIHTYPNGSQASFARLLLGICLLPQAAVPPPSGPTAAKAAAMRSETLQLFRTVRSEIDAKQKAGKGTEHDAWLRVQAEIRILQTHLQMKQYNDLLLESADLLTRYRNTIEELIVRSLIYHAFDQQFKASERKAERDHYLVQMLQTRDKMKELFDHLSPSAFTGVTEEYTREYWEKNWFVPERK